MSAFTVRLNLSDESLRENPDVNEYLTECEHILQKWLDGNVPVDHESVAKQLAVESSL